MTSGIFVNNKSIDSIYAGDAFATSVVFANTTISEFTPPPDRTITVNASNDASILLTTYRTNTSISGTSSANITVKDGDIVFYKITKEGYNTIYSWVKADNDITINKTLTQLCFKFTTNTLNSGVAPEEAYSLKFTLRNRSTYSTYKTLYVNWEDVKDITYMMDYGTYEEIGIADEVSYSDGLDVDTSNWLSETIPCYTDADCTQFDCNFEDFTSDYYVYFLPREESGCYKAGWLKTGYSESIPYKLPFAIADDGFAQSGAILTINWGDQSTSTITGELTANKLTHSYINPGPYQISITSSNNKMPRLSFYDDNAYYQAEDLISIDTPLLEFADNEPSLSGAFYECTNLSSICDQAFSNLKNIVSASNLFYDCKNLYTLPKGLLNLTGCAQYNSAFKYTSNLKHDEFFNREVLKNINSSIDFTNMFEQSSYTNLETGKIQALWNLQFKQPPVTTNAYKGNNTDSATNWLKVPRTWGGPVDIFVNVVCSNDQNASISINNKTAYEAMKSGEKYTYTLTPSNLSQYIPYKGLGYAKGTTPQAVDTVTKAAAKTYQFGTFPTDGSHMPMQLWKIDDKLFASSPSGSSNIYEGSTNVQVYIYNAARDYWYGARGIPKDTTLTEGSYSASAGVFKIGSKYFSVMKNGKVYSSLDGYNWSEETNTSGIAEYATDWQFPDGLTSNNTNLAIIKLYGGALLYTEDGINYYSCTGTTSGYSYCLKYYNNYFWVSRGNKLYRSDDGKTFSQVVALNKDFYALSYANGMYFGQPYGVKEIWYSSNGTTWNKSTLDTLTYGVKYYNGKYITSINYGSTLITSLDGINWDTKITDKGSITAFKDTLLLDDGVLLYGSYSSITQYNLGLYI